MNDINIINGLEKLYCDADYYTREDLVKLLRTRKIDLSGYDNAESVIEDRALGFNKTVSEDQYRKFVTLQIATNIKERFSQNKSITYRNKYLNNEADLLSKAIAPFVASSYIPSGNKPATGANGLIINLKSRGKMVETAIDYCLSVYHTHGFMPQLDASLNPVGVIMPSGFSRNTKDPIMHGKVEIERGGEVKTEATLQELHKLLKAGVGERIHGSARAGVRNLTRNQKINTLKNKYKISQEEAEKVLDRFEQAHRYIRLIRKDDENGGSSYEKPLFARHGTYPRKYLWQYIVNDTRAKRRGSVFDIPHTWRMASRIGFTSAISWMGKDSSGRSYRDVSAYKNTIYETIFNHKKIEYMGHLNSFVRPGELRNLPLVGRMAIPNRKWAGTNKTNPLLYSDFIDSGVFIEANEKNIPDKLENLRTEVRKENRGWNFGLKRFQRAVNSRKIEAYRQPIKKKKKARGLNFLDFILAVPALIVDAITFMATDVALGAIKVLDKAGILSEEGFYRTILSGNVEAGLWDKMMLSWDGLKFSLSGLKLIFKDSLEAAIPGAFIAVISGSPVLGGVVAGVMFVPKFFGDFLGMFSMSGPAGDIVTKVVSDFGASSLSGGEIAMKSAFSGVYIGVPLFVLSTFFGVPLSTAALVTGVVVGARATDLFLTEKLIPRFTDASALDASTLTELRFTSKYLFNFGGPSAVLAGIGVATGNPFFLIAGGAGFVSSATIDFFRNALFESTTIKSLDGGLEVVHGPVAFAIGPAIIGGAIGGPVGAVIGAAVGGVTGFGLNFMKHSLSSIAVDPRSAIFEDNLGKALEAQQKLIDFKPGDLGLDRRFLRDFGTNRSDINNALNRLGDRSFTIEDLESWGLKDSDIERLFTGRTSFSGNVLGVKNINLEFAASKGEAEMLRGMYLKDFVNEDKLVSVITARDGAIPKVGGESSRVYLEKNFDGYGKFKLDQFGDKFKELDLKDYFEGSRFAVNLEHVNNLFLSDILDEDKLTELLAKINSGGIMPNGLETVLSERGIEIGSIDVETLKGMQLSELGRAGLLTKDFVSAEEFTGTALKFDEVGIKALQAAPWSIAKIAAIMRSDIRLPIPGVSHAAFADISPAINAGVVSGIALSLVVSPLPAALIGGGVAISKLILTSLAKDPNVSSIVQGTVGLEGRELIGAFSHSLGLGVVTFVVATLLGQSALTAGLISGGVTLAYTGVRYILRETFPNIAKVGGAAEKMGVFGKFLTDTLHIPDWAVHLFSMKGMFDAAMVIQLDDQLLNPVKFITSLTAGGLTGVWSLVTLGFGIAGGFGLAGILFSVLGVTGAGFLLTAGVGLGIVVGGLAVDFLVKAFTGFDIGQWVIRGVSNLFSSIFGHAAGAFSWGLDIVVTMLLLIFRTEFDVDEFLRIIVTAVFGIAIFMEIFGSGNASGSSNSNTSNVLNSNHNAQAGTTGYLISPYSGKIVNIVSGGKVLADTVYIKKSNGENVVVSNVYNPYLYVGENIYKGSFIGNSEK